VREVDDSELISNNLKIIEMMSQDGASPPLDQYWDPIIEVLSKDMGITEELLMKCNSHEINLMGGYFEDVSYRLQSQAFIDLLHQLQLKHPDIDMEQDIQWAIDALD
jgi:hypothetical protein